MAILGVELAGPEQNRFQPQPVNLLQWIKGSRDMIARIGAGMRFCAVAWLAWGGQQHWRLPCCVCNLI